MRKFFLFITVVLLTSCAGSRLTSEERAARDAAVVQMIEDSLTARTFRVDVDYMIPQRMQPRMLSYGYNITVHGDSISSYLPYFGEAWQTAYGRDEGLIFEGELLHYAAKRHKKGYYMVEMAIRRMYDNLVYRLEIFDNGKASLYVRSDNRRSISYNGEMILNP